MMEGETKGDKQKSTKYVFVDSFPKFSKQLRQARVSVHVCHVCGRDQNAWTIGTAYIDVHLKEPGIVSGARVGNYVHLYRMWAY